MIALFVSLLAGCESANSCQEYYDAVIGCYEAGGADASAYSATACENWSAEMETLWGEYYQCNAAAWDGKDCSNADDITAASEAAGECEAPAG